VLGVLILAGIYALNRAFMMIQFKTPYKHLQTPGMEAGRYKLACAPYNTVVRQT
jgi:hypothetical protein